MLAEDDFLRHQVHVPSDLWRWLNCHLADTHCACFACPGFTAQICTAHRTPQPCAVAQISQGLPPREELSLAPVGRPPHISPFNFRGSSTETKKRTVAPSSLLQKIKCWFPVHGPVQSRGASGPNIARPCLPFLFPENKKTMNPGYNHPHIE